MPEHYEPEMADPGDGDMFGAFEDAVLRKTRGTMTCHACHGRGVVTGVPSLSLERWVCRSCGILHGEDEKGAQRHEANYGADRHAVARVRFIPDSPGATA